MRHLSGPLSVVSLTSVWVCSARVCSQLRTLAASRDGFSSVDYDSSKGTVETIHMSGERNHEILKAFLEEHGDATSEEEFHQNLNTCADAAAWAPRASTQERFVERMTPEFQQLARVVREVLQGRELETLVLSGGGSLCPGLEAFMRREFPRAGVEVQGPGGMSRRALESFLAGADNERGFCSRARAYVSR